MSSNATADARESSEVETLADVTAADCNKWFFCRSCGLEYHDGNAEVFDDTLVSQCECGATQTKPVAEAFEGTTRLQRRRSENAQLEEWSG